MAQSRSRRLPPPLTSPLLPPPVPLPPCQASWPSLAQGPVSALVCLPDEFPTTAQVQSNWCWPERHPLALRSHHSSPHIPPRAELINGRLAMLAFVAALGAELSSGESVLRQLGDEPTGESAR